ncbi:MAG: hypothetical protein COU07_00675 [Candidatus Harrisonbacteria bacterium CG10_big_fil_rev_8_21_14_0_10_40_38]|uniref:Uncharacterized protein n=1 Tax=Candidatus Harrisonbacteria bacterium CG10_big_fil_rev_8_21_14_0_10_40_38 TaxID=1974583 RepID=A0A2H0USL2_9BACT|nr:MAG: hypothetical protein COU07_00675 [Candidatus Harrisonbacteria bacterium CG10_big_fil_rev_8_21_14_0_10_40_38]
MDSEGKKYSGKELWSIGIATILVVAAIFLVALFKTNEIPSENINTSDWETYESPEFNFSIRYPKDWQISEFPENPISPTFNIYPKNITDDPPFNHFNLIPNVSIFPQGVPTEGVIGTNVPSDIIFSEETNRAIDFLMENGKSWATYTSFLNLPKNWSSDGFVWARVKITDFSVSCERDGREINLTECNTFTGHDHYIYRGETDEEVRKIEEAMLKSFKFLKETNNQ